MLFSIKNFKWAIKKVFLVQEKFLNIKKQQFFLLFHVRCNQQQQNVEQNVGALVSLGNFVFAIKCTRSFSSELSVHNIWISNIFSLLLFVLNRAKQIARIFIDKLCAREKRKNCLIQWREIVQNVSIIVDFFWFVDGRRKRTFWPFSDFSPFSSRLRFNYVSFWNFPVTSSAWQQEHFIGFCLWLSCRDIRMKHRPKVSH